MDNNLFKQDESFRFDISISDRRYDHKPTSEDYQAMTFHVEDLNADDLLDRITSGYSICHIFKNNRRVMKNFLYTNAVFIDVDDSPQPMNSFLDGCDFTPSIAYTTISDGKNGLYRFRLIYLLNEQIASVEEYKYLYDIFIKKVSLIETKDNCGAVATQLMNGNSNNNVRVFSSNYVWNKRSFLQNCHLELYTPHTHTQYISNQQFCKKGETNINMDHDEK